MHKGFPGLRTCCADRKNVIQECKIPSTKAILNGFCMQRFCGRIPFSQRNRYAGETVMAEIEGKVGEIQIWEWRQTIRPTRLRKV